ncbi:MAG: major facilitator superfamily 1 [Pseudonocardiales bacterium]|nr:major facilitator superfamily 1 [Pseudonocardiales bacterium]
MNASGRRVSRPLLVFASTSMGAFFVLGLPDGMLGVAWPAMRRSHHQPVSALSILLLAGTCAFFIMTLTSGALVRRYGASVAVISASAGAVLGALAAGLGHGFWTALVGMALLGACGGLVDSALSSIVSMAGNGRLMGLLHACYGAGAAGAPLVVAVCISASSWRASYLTLVVAQVAVLAGWLGSGARRSLSMPAEPTEPVDHATSAAERRGPLVLGLAVFFLVSGLEIAAGAWAATYLTDSLHQTAGVASFCVFAYWTALTTSRLSVGIWGARAATSWMIIGCGAGVVGCAVFWWSPTAMWSVVGLVLVAAGTGPVLPLLTSLTPGRVGHAAAPRVIGWQLSAASLGSAFVSGAVGLGVQRAGLGAIGFVLTVVAVLVTGLIVLLGAQPKNSRAASRAAPSKVASPSSGT